MPYPFTLLFLLLCPMIIKGQVGKDHALFFPVNTYSNSKLHDLRYPIKEARAIAKVVEQYYMFETEVVENASYQQIDEKLKEYASKYAQGSYEQNGQLFIYFSGHGLSELGHGFFLAKDSDPGQLGRTAFLYDYWRSYINAIQCDHILVAVDACYSGLFDPGKAASLQASSPGSESRSRTFVTSATLTQTPDQSQFAKQFLKGLATRGGIDNQLSFSELYQYLELALPHPHWGHFGHHHQSTEFIFAANEQQRLLEMRAPTTARQIADQEAWEAAKADHHQYNYMLYLEHFPDGRYVEDAKRQIEALKDLEYWEKAQTTHTRESYLAYLERFPQGNFVASARRAIQQLMERSENNAIMPPLIDSQENRYTYKLMKDSLYWMVDNLKAWTGNSYCFEEEYDNCIKYGRLYTWEDAKRACAMLGDGWHLPTTRHWQKLIDSYSVNTTAYESLLMNGESGLNLMPAGTRFTDGKFSGLGGGGYWSYDEAWTRQMTPLDVIKEAEAFIFAEAYQAGYIQSVLKKFGLSVRCIKQPQSKKED